MTRPHPVVGIATKFTDVGRRGSHQAHILICFGDEHIKLIAMVKRFHSCFIMRVFHGFCFQSICIFL